MVDGISDYIFFDILGGNQQMHRKKPIPDKEAPESHPKKKSILAEKPVDIDLHKKMIRRFMRMNKKMQK